jgi:hypothetical protein
LCSVACLRVAVQEVRGACADAADVVDGGEDVVIVSGRRTGTGPVRVSRVDAGVTGLGVDVGPVVDFAAGTTRVTVSVQLWKWGSSRNDKPDSTAVVRVRRDAKTAVRFRRERINGCPQPRL